MVQPTRGNVNGPFDRQADPVRFSLLTGSHAIDFSYYSFISALFTDECGLRTNNCVHFSSSEPHLLRNDSHGSITVMPTLPGVGLTLQDTVMYANVCKPGRAGWRKGPIAICVSNFFACRFADRHSFGGKGCSRHLPCDPRSRQVSFGSIPLLSTLRD
jgi:hypothetical protein